MAYTDGNWERKRELKRKGEIVKYITCLYTPVTTVMRPKLLNHWKMLLFITLSKGYLEFMVEK